MAILREQDSTVSKNSASIDSTASRHRSLPTREEIEIAAYEIYVSRGAADGRDVDDWLQAEKELSAQPRAQTAKSKVTAA